MDVDELIKRAWDAVQQAGVSEAAQATALQEAIAYLRDQDGSGGGGGGGGGSGGDRTPPRAAAGRRRRRAGSRAASGSEADQADDLPDEGAFFAELSSESGIDQEKLRDVLLYKGGKVTVTPPTRMFGTSKTAQAKAITALVAGARAKGMGEVPVKAEAVHEELKRKQCWDKNNFARGHLGKLQGFNGGSDRTEITTTSKWVGEFGAAVKQALGEADDE